MPDDLRLYRGTRDFTLKARGSGYATIEPHNEAAWRFIRSIADDAHYSERDGELWMESSYAATLMNEIVERGHRIACNC